MTGCRRIRSGLGNHFACAAHGNPWPCDLRALSLTRPWTELILSKIKDVENRGWSSPYRGLLVIHAAKSWDDAALAVTTELSTDGALTEEDYARLDGCAMTAAAPTGYLGVVTLTDIHHDGSLACSDQRTEAFTTPCSPWAFSGSYHWMITDARRFPVPIDGGGTLGLFQPPADLHARLREAIQEVGAE